MSLRNLVAALGVVVALGACTESTSPRPDASAPAPTFLRWAPSARSQLSTQGGAVQLAPSVAAALAPVTAPTVTGTSSGVVAGGKSMSWSHTVGTDASRLLLVSVSLTAPNRWVSQVTFGGVQLTRLGVSSNHDNAVRVEFWSLQQPSSGTATVSVKLSGTVDATAGAMTLAGVDPDAPLGAFVSNGSTDAGTLDPSVAESGFSAQLMVAAIAAEGTAGTLTPAAGQTQRYQRASGPDIDENAGAASTASGDANFVAGWRKSGQAKWAIAAVAVNPQAPGAVALASYRASFWAKRGASRTLQINYAGNGGASPFMQLTVSDPTFVPGRGNIAMGDSVLVTATVDPYLLSVDFAPSGTTFGTASSLKMYYSGAGGDLNGDGVVDAYDATIEQNLLGMWWQADSASPWKPLVAVKSTATKSLQAQLQHFSGYAIAW